VSWVAHDVEPYVIVRHLGGRVSFLAVLIGSWSPDLVTKWMVYGVTTGISYHTDDPFEFHRGWPGVGPLHSPVFGIAMAIAVLLIFRSHPWAWGLLIGQWAHAFSDTMDSNGVMLLFPFTETRTSVDAWTYAAEHGRTLDTAAYFSSPGLLWDCFWVGMTLVRWRVLSAAYFRDTVLPADPVWGWTGRYLPPQALLVLYRAAFFYGTGRLVAWVLWAHVLNSYEFDFTWGGPGWVKDLE